MLFPALWWAVSGPGTIVAVSWMHALVAFISALLSLHVAARVLNIGVKAVYAAVYPAAVAGCVMAAAVYGVLILAASMLPFIQLLLGFFVGGIVYILVLWFFQRDVVVEAGHKLRAVFGQR
jgi:hypothetical protein